MLGLAAEAALGASTPGNPGTTKCPEEPFDRTAGLRVPAALTTAGKESEDFSLSGGPRSGHCRTCHRALYIPVSAVYVLRPAQEPLRVQKLSYRSLAPFPPEPLAWCRSRWPLRARQNVSPARRGRKGLIHQFRSA